MPFARKATLVNLRSFLNPDLPRLRQLWDQCQLGRGAASGFSNDTWDYCTFSQLHFDQAGLIVACDTSQAIVGFVHAAPIPKESGWNCPASSGAISAIMVHPGHRRQGVGRLLLQQAEQYLRKRGVTQVFAGESYPCDLFYFGLYGSSCAVGFLESDRHAMPFLQASEYQPAESWTVYEKRLGDGRDPFDPRLVNIRRKYELVGSTMPLEPTRRWITLEGRLDSICFHLVPQEGGAPVASLTAWAMEFHSQHRGQRTVGLCDLEVAPSERRKGLGKALLIEVCRNLQAEGYSHVEVAVRESDATGHSLVQKLGFLRCDRGICYSKRLVA